VNHHNKNWKDRFYNLYEGITSVKLLLFLFITYIYKVNDQTFDWQYVALAGMLIAPRAAQELIYAWKCNDGKRAQEGEGGI